MRNKKFYATCGCLCELSAEYNKVQEDLMDVEINIVELICDYHKKRKQIVKVDENVAPWLLEKLQAWNETYAGVADEDDESEDAPETSLDPIIAAFHDGDFSLTPHQCSEILFHLWQADQGE